MTVSSRLLGRVSSGLVFVASGANAIGTIVVLILVLVLNADVIARGAFHHPIRGVHEVVQFSMVLIVFLQLPDVVRNDRLTRSDGLFVVLSQRFPGFVTLIGRIIDILAATIMVLIAVAMWPEFVDAWETNHFFGTPGIFTAPWWPVRLVIVLSAILCALIWAAKALTGQRVLRQDAFELDRARS
jgi:TRAP-type mannitol/chloroaromatic compound transport system permease small subunit